MQRGKARPKTSKVSKTPSRLQALSWVGTTVPPRMPNADPTIYTMVQSLTPSVIACTTQFGSYYFTISQLDQFSSLGSVFDQYRIDEIEMTFRPAVNTLNNELITVIDWDDASVPGTIAYLDEYANACVSMNETQVRRWKPSVAVPAYQATSSGYTNVQSPWIDCAGNTVQHYGLKYGYSIISGTTYHSVNVRMRCSFRLVH
jgi:hypothetical protein